MSDKLRKGLRINLISAALFFAVLAAEKSGVCPGLFGNRLISLVLYLIPYFLCGHHVVRKAVLGVIHGQMLDESFLMTLASIGAFATGQYEEAVAVMLFYQVGEWFQSYAVGRSRKSITELMDIAPEEANVEQEDGSFETVDPDDVAIGDVLVIRPGEKIPIDGTVLTGESLINTAALTGESVPRKVSEGDPVVSGCVNGEGLLRVRADKAYEDSTVSRILEMVESASEKKSRTENFITRFAKVYTPIVVIAALVLAVIPSLMTGNWMTWIYRACTFLVISCPCALVISVPLAFFGGIGAASKNGVLVKGSNYLEQTARLKTVVTDKTGTLTEGCFAVSSVECAEGVSPREVLLCAAAAEGLSTHPIALSIREAIAGQNSGGTETDGDGFFISAPSETENISGQGIMAVADGARLLVGNGKLMESNGIAFPPVQDEAATVCYVAKDGRYLGAILIRDTVKADAGEAIREMRRQGVERIIMLTGDRKSVSEAVGRELGLTETCAELMPQDKVRKVEDLLGGSNGVVAFIGDGINDAPVLMRADVGIAMGSMGSDAAIEAADIVIMDDDLKRVPAVIRIARMTVRISKQNIVFAIGVKLLILLLGALGIANMWAAVFADVGVAVLCILNSMRLLAVRSTM